MKTITLLKRKLFRTLTVASLFVAPAASAQTLASWNPTGVFNYGPSPWAPTATHSNVTVGGWTRGAGVGLSGTAANNAFGGNNWTGASNEDITFTITSNPGITVSYTAFTLFYRHSGTGPGSGTLEYTFGNGTTYTVITTMTFANNTSTGAALSPISLTGISNLQNVAPGTIVKFRILPTGGGSAGTWYIFGTGASLDGTFSSFVGNITETSPIACNSQSTGVLTNSVTGSTPPYTYSWAPTGGTTSVAAGLSAGVYTCFVTSSTSETTLVTYTLTEPAVISGSVISQQNIPCHGGTTGAATVSPIGGTPSYSLSWSPAGGTNSVTSNLAAGIYTLTISDINNCTGSQTVAISEPPSSIAIFATNTMVCSGASVVVNAVGANTYSWTQGISNGIAFTTTTSATYVVYATNTLSGCTERDSVSIIVNPSPTITAASSRSNSTICSGNDITLSASGANVYTWTGGISNGMSFTPTATQSYSVTGSDFNGCTGTAVITVSVNQTPNVSISSSRSTSCKGETVTLTAHGATTYSWSTHATTSLVAVSPSATVVYTVTGIDANGCSDTSSVQQRVSNCLGIESIDADTESSLSIFPNPNAGEFSVSSASNADLLIVNELGQTVQRIELNGSNNRETKVNGLSSGIYFIRSVNTNYNVSKKLVVAR